MAGRAPSSDPSPSRRMPVGSALAVLAKLRREDQIVVTQMGSSREWPKIADEHPLDFHYIPSAMGGGPPLALGLALAQPGRDVLAISGDGSLLMSLGALVTIVESGAENLTLVTLDNGVYEIIGGQKIAGAAADLAGFAQAAGFPSVFSFEDLADWQSQAPQALTSPGPRFIRLGVAPVRENYLLDPPCPIQQQLARLRQGLGLAPLALPFCALHFALCNLHSALA